MSATPAFLELYGQITDALILFVLLSGLALSLARASLSKGVRIVTWFVIAFMLAAWYGLSVVLASRDVYLARPEVTFPALPVAVFVPIIVGLTLIFYSKTMAKIVDATPVSWLIGLQFYRVVGVIFLILWGRGELPGEFALPAGIGDIITGLLAPFAARAAANGDRRRAYFWNALGIADFIVALATGFLSSPGRFQLLAIDHPNLIASAYPLALIPVYLVPLSSILHGITLWKLRRLEREGAQGHTLRT